MSRSHQSSGGASQRMLRVAELVKHAVSELLARGDVTDPDLAGKVVTVPEVRMSPDLKLATIFVMPLGGGDTQKVVDALDRNKKFLRGEIAHRINMKFAPDIRFRLDTSFERGAKIDAILDSPKVKQDLIERPEEDGA